MKAVFAVLALTMLVLLSGCSKETEMKKPQKETVYPAAVQTVNPAEEERYDNLYCLSEDKAMAQEIAELYGIELVNFQQGVATFHCEGDPYETVRKGMEQGLPELSVNQTMKAFG